MRGEADYYVYLLGSGNTVRRFRAYPAIIYKSHRNRGCGKMVHIIRTLIEVYDTWCEHIGIGERVREHIFNADIVLVCWCACGRGMPWLCQHYAHERRKHVADSNDETPRTWAGGRSMYLTEKFGG